MKTASVIDYVREALDKDLFNVEGELTLRPEIRNQIEDVVYSAIDDLDLPDESVKDVFIYGSILTNQYNPKTDVDCRIVLDPEVVKSKYPNVTGDHLFDVVMEVIHDIPLGDTEHPLNCTIVIEGETTELGRSPLGKTKDDPVFDVLNDRVVSLPAMQDPNFDPDEEFQEEMDEATEIMHNLDKLFLETKKDVVDFEWLQDAVKDVKYKDKFVKKLNDKILEIEEDLKKIVQEYTKIKDERTEGLTTETEESRHKSPGNVRFKVMEKYFYIDTLRKLKKIFKGGVTPEEVEELAETLNVSGQRVRRLYSDEHPPKSGNPKEIYRALKAAGFVVHELYYNPYKELKNYKCLVEKDGHQTEYGCGVNKVNGYVFLREQIPPYTIQWLEPVRRVEHAF